MAIFDWPRPPTAAVVRPKQARKSSEDTQVAGYAWFEKVWVGSEKLGPKIFLSIFSLNWTNFRKSYPDPKLKNNWGPPPLSLTFHVGRPETLTEWKSESITDQRTDGHLTWGGGGKIKKIEKN